MRKQIRALLMVMLGTLGLVIATPSHADMGSDLDKFNKSLSKYYEEAQKITKKLNKMYKKYGPAVDKAIVSLGLTGGTNTLFIKKVIQPAAIKVKKGKVTLRLPLVLAEAKCKRSGYRIIQFGPVKSKPKLTKFKFPVVPNTISKVGGWKSWTKKVSKLAKNLCKKNGPKMLPPVPVSVHGQCGKAPGKIVVGKKKYNMTAPAYPVAVQLQCK